MAQAMCWRSQDLRFPVGQKTPPPNPGTICQVAEPRNDLLGSAFVWAKDA